MITKVLSSIRSMSTAQRSLPIRPSASLIIAAPTPANATGVGSNYRVLMMKRNAKSSFINAHVYPGGNVDTSDHFTHWSNDNFTEKEGNILTNKICAIRETFEESGLLLCNPPVHTVNDLDVNTWRHIVHDDASQFKVMCDKYSIRPAVEKLVPFSNWITPVIEKRRYNTLFFLTVLDEYKTKSEQDLQLNVVAADGKETVLFDWFKPEEAIQQHSEKKLIMIPPQWYSLTILSQIPNHDDLLKNAGVEAFKTKDNEVISILPQAYPAELESAEGKDGYTLYLAYPGDESYESKQYTSKPGNKHRLYFKGRMEQFRLERNVNASDIIINSSSL